MPIVDFGSVMDAQNQVASNLVDLRPEEELKKNFAGFFLGIGSADGDIVQVPREDDCLQGPSEQENQKMPKECASI